MEKKAYELHFFDLEKKIINAELKQSSNFEPELIKRSMLLIRRIYIMLMFSV